MKLIYKLNLVPLISTVLLAIIILISILSGRKNEKLLNQIDKNIVPSLLIIKELKSNLQQYRQALMNAGVTGEKDQLSASDGLYKEIQQSLDSLKSVVPAELSLQTKIAELVPQYHDISYQFTEQMIGGKFGDPSEMSKLYENVMAQIETDSKMLKSLMYTKFEKSQNHLRAITTYLQLLFIFSVCALILGITITFVITKSIKQASSNLQDMAMGEGDLTKRLAEKGTDEISELSKWFNVFVEKIQGIVKELSGNTTVLNKASEKLSETATKIASNAEETSAQAKTVSSATEQSNSNITSISAATEEMSVEMTTVASAIEEMNTIVNEITKSCQKEFAIANDANDQAKASRELMENLRNSSKEIGKIIKVINYLADQTNLLALNASLEAASAGDAGHGFNVVAKEVKELAKQTAKATTQIQEQVEKMQGDTNKSIDSIIAITTTIGEINTHSQSIVNAMEQQSLAVNGISRNVAEASRVANEISKNVSNSAVGLSEISNNIAGVNAAAADTSYGIAQISASSNELANLSSQLSAITGRFKIS